MLHRIELSLCSHMTLYKIRSKHDDSILHIATTYIFCTSLLDHFGRSNGHSLQEHIHTIDRMVVAYVEACGFSAGELQAAKQSIIAAGVALRSADRASGVIDSGVAQHDQGDS